MLELKNISYVVNDELGEKAILKNINLTLDDRFVAFTGPNGGGKSTLAKVIAGIVTPTEGKIYLDGEDITGLSVTERAKCGVSYAFQQPVRFKGLTVRDLINISAGKTLKVSDACFYLSEVGMCARDYIDREVNASLSGGELKRIEIAMILARSTKLSIFDEPEAGIGLPDGDEVVGGGNGEGADGDDALEELHLARGLGDLQGDQVAGRAGESCVFGGQIQGHPMLKEIGNIAVV